MKKICFRVDANQNIGQGHAMRCLSIANELSDNYDAQCIFAVSDESSARFFTMRKKEVINLGLDYKDYSLFAAKAMLKIIDNPILQIKIIHSLSYLKNTAFALFNFINSRSICIFNFSFIFKK